MQYLIIFAAHFIGFRNDSTRSSYIMSGIYVTNLISYGCIWIFITFDGRPETAFYYIEFMRNSIYNDFNSAWFQTIGTIIVENMAILALMPIANFFLAYIIRHVRRMYDQRKCWPNNLLKTRCGTLLAFEKLYNGPEF